MVEPAVQQQWAGETAQAQAAAQVQKRFTSDQLAESPDYLWSVGLRCFSVLWQLLQFVLQLLRPTSSSSATATWFRQVGTIHPQAQSCSKIICSSERQSEPSKTQIQSGTTRCGRGCHQASRLVLLSRKKCRFSTRFSLLCFPIFIIIQIQLSNRITRLWSHTFAIIGGGAASWSCSWTCRALCGGNQTIQVVTIV